MLNTNFEDTALCALQKKLEQKIARIEERQLATAKKQADKKKFDVFGRVDLKEEILAMKKIGDEYVVAQNLCRSLLRENEELKQRQPTYLQCKSGFVCTTLLAMYAIAITLAFVIMLVVYLKV